MTNRERTLRPCILGFVSLLCPTTSFLFVTPSQPLRTARALQISSAEPLLPLENPDATPYQLTSSGVRWGDIYEALQAVYAPALLEQRHQWSRQDGYWPYVQQNQEPPAEYVYGEFDFYFFAQLLEKAAPPGGWTSQHTFCDLGSGAGRLAVAAAALYPFGRVRGVEVLQSLHDQAEPLVEQVRKDGLVVPSTGDTLSLAPVQLECASFTDPYLYLADCDLIFCFSSCLSPPIRHQLAQSIGRLCRPGTMVLTTDYMLELEGVIEKSDKDERLPHGSYRLSLVDKMDGFCWVTDGASTCYLHRVEASSWPVDRLEPIERPQMTTADICYEVAMALEHGELTDTDAFIRSVTNEMIFRGFPEHFLPRRPQ